MRYAIFDPTGNVTALVEEEVPSEARPHVARQVMDRHTDVEQVGFVTDGTEGTDGRLTMAGGEFCGNATMSAAALLLMRRQEGSPTGHEEQLMRLEVSGAEGPIEVRLARTAEDSFEGAVHMPRARSIELVALSFGSVQAEVPVVFMEGISHAVIGEDSPFAGLMSQSGNAEACVRTWCAELGADGLGMMFLSGTDAMSSLTPLVYVPGSGTCFWERSCASGTSACGMLKAARTGQRVDLSFFEPGGTLRVTAAPDGTCWLKGHVREVSRYA